MLPSTRSFLWFKGLLAWLCVSRALSDARDKHTSRWHIRDWLEDSGGAPAKSRPQPSALASEKVRDARLADVEASLPSTRPSLLQWSEDLIEENGGTILAIAGRDYCVIAADTRLSADYQIRSRNITRIMRVSARTAVGTAGGWADVIALNKELGYELGRYSSLHGPMSTSALATFLSNCLYLHRLKPLYALNVVAGLDAQGRGSVYTYDAVGSYNRVAAACCGRGQKLMQPVLDGLAEGEGAVGEGLGENGPYLATLSCEDAVKVVREAFLSGAEREISIGDEVEILVFRAGRSRPEIQRHPLPHH